MIFQGFLLANLFERERIHFKPAAVMAGTAGAAMR